MRSYTCIICGTPTYKSTKLYCSHSCHRIAINERQAKKRREERKKRAAIGIRMCGICGMPFEVTAANKLHCSDACKTIRRNMLYKQRQEAGEIKICLKCDKKFRSMGNRVCPSCTVENENICTGSEVGVWIARI